MVTQTTIRISEEDWKRRKKAVVPPGRNEIGKVRRMKCPVCHKFVTPVRIGATIGEGQLTACPKCGTVFCESAIEKPSNEGVIEVARAFIRQIEADTDILVMKADLLNGKVRRMGRDFETEADYLQAKAELYEAESLPPCPVAGCTAVVRPGVLREYVICPVHGEQWVGEEDEP